MIIQRVIKGVNGISHAQAQSILGEGITCRWWQNVNPLPRVEIPQRLTERNLDWHQNRYDSPDPLENNQPFFERTPFISTTAGTVERDTVQQTNLLTPAWEVALRFATDMWKTDGYLFHCYVLIIGRRAVAHEAFAEELRELNIYNGFSPYQPEGELLAKIVIPPSQVERVEFWRRDDALKAARSGFLPTPSSSIQNPLFVAPDDYSNVREVLG